MVWPPVFVVSAFLMFFLPFFCLATVIIPGVIDILSSTSRAVVLLWLGGMGFTTWLFVVGRWSICNYSQRSLEVYVNRQMRRLTWRISDTNGDMYETTR